MWPQLNSFGVRRQRHGRSGGWSGKKRGGGHRAGETVIGKNAGRDAKPLRTPGAWQDGQVAPFDILAPFRLVLAANQLGDTLRDRLDVTSRSSS
jgi:hypothetical protein